MRQSTVLGFTLLLALSVAPSVAQPPAPATPTPGRRVVARIAKSSEIVDPSVTITPEAYRLQCVEMVFSLGSPVSSSTIQLERMGDEAAVALMKILGSRAQFTEAETKTALEILQWAFAKPGSILDDSNKKPRATLFLLHVLNSTAQDQSTRDQVAKIQRLVAGGNPPIAQEK